MVIGMDWAFFILLYYAALVRYIIEWLASFAK